MDSLILQSKEHMDSLILSDENDKICYFCGKCCNSSARIFKDNSMQVICFECLSDNEIKADRQAQTGTERSIRG